MTKDAEHRDQMRWDCLREARDPDVWVESAINANRSLKHASEILQKCSMLIRWNQGNSRALV
jgi:hypothetical protein